MINAIILGTTGMIGEGVLHKSLEHPDVESVLVVNRRPCGVQHEKLKEIIHKDFFDLTPIKDQLGGYNACFFCLGVSSVGMNEEDYRKMTYDLTLNFAKTVIELNEAMTFTYVSGAGTDSSEQGRSMWARVKGKTENDLLKLPFKGTFTFRPGYIQPMPGMKNTLKFYKYISFLYPVLKTLFPAYVCTLSDIGTAMLKVCSDGYSKKVLENKDITLLGNQK
jgi:uncharacterized protein YbjT (DUF2867 family)